MRAALRYISDHAREGAEVEAVTVGRKGRDQLRRAGVPIAAHFSRLGDRPAFSDVTPIARLVTDDFLAEKYDEIAVAYAGFVSTLTQRADVLSILPVVQPEEMTADEAARTDEYLFEPSPRRCSAGSCRTTSPSTSTAPCSSRTPPSRARG